MTNIITHKLNVSTFISQVVQYHFSKFITYILVSKIGINIYVVGILLTVL